MRYCHIACNNIYFHLAIIICHYAVRGGEKFVMTIIALVVVGQCLLLIADEPRFIVYVRLALFLCFYAFIADFLRI